MVARLLCLALTVVALASCGTGEKLPPKPQLKVDRTSLGFGWEFGSGTFIGTKPQESLYIQNGGLENLKISSVDQSGDKEFTFEGPTKMELKGLERTFIRVVFAPTAEKAYRGELTIRSNAENTPQQVISLSGCGVKASTDGGGDPVSKICP